MTDKEKLEKVRAEIERLYNQSLVDENRQAELGLKSAAFTSYGKSKSCKELLSFIDSLPEEPVSEDLEEEIKKYAQTYYKNNDISELARHFANWQKEQIMKDAVDGGCFSYRNGYKHISCDIDEHLTDIKLGDKVKVAIIKED